MKGNSIFAAAVVVLAASAAIAAPPPKVGIASLSDLPSMDRRPFNADANADADVDAALARARKNGKRVLIDLGGNWCVDCLLFASVMHLPEVEPFVAAHFEVVAVDVGRINRNLQIPARFGITQKIIGVPAVLIVDANGKLLNGGHIEALADARSMTPQAIVDWLANWSD